MAKWTTMLLLVNVAGTLTFDSTREQYESFPYPPIDPFEAVLLHAQDQRRTGVAFDDEGIVLQSPSHIIEISHYVFGGRRNFCEGVFRILIAGGGTGEKTLQLATQIRDMGAERNFDLIHLDISTASIAIARKRAEIRGLGHAIRFVHGSVESITSNDLGGRFHYIDCLGVLHHLASPISGLSNLENLLTDDGGMGLMFYGELGRTGIYHAQEMLRMMNVPPTSSGIEFARNFISAALPSTNWLRANPSRWEMFNMSMQNTEDAQLIDVLMPYRDVAYRVDQVYAMVEAADLKVLQLLQPAVYRPESYVDDPSVLERVPRDERSRAVFAELLAGNIGHHFLYVGKRETESVGPFRLTASADEMRSFVPVPHFFDPLELSDLLTQWSGSLPWTHRGLRIRLPLPEDASKIVRLIDGARTLEDIHTALVDNRNATTCDSFTAFLEGPFRILYEALNGINKLYMAQGPTTPVQLLRTPQSGRIQAKGFPKNPYHAPARCAS